MVAAAVSDPIMRYSADEWRAMAARKSLLSFGSRMFRGYIDAEHIRRMIEAIEATVSTPDGRLIITLPPRHSKSLNVSEHLPAWYLGNHPDERIIAASHTAGLAYTFSRRVRNKFDHHKWPFPGIRIAGDKSSVQAWDIEGHRGGYIAVGVGGSPTGHGGNGLIVDDPIRNAADAESETIRESTWEWYQGTLRTRLEPGGWIIITATRWHEDDPTGRLLEAMKSGGEEWTHLHMPAISDEGEALWPERWPLRALERTKVAVGSRTFEAQYQGRPSPADGGMFKRDWWQRYASLPVDPDGGTRFVRVELVLDSAFKDGVGNDYSVYALWGVTATGSAYLIRIWRHKLQFPALIQMGHDAHAWARFQFPTLAIPLVIEDKASGQSAIQVFSQPYHTERGVLPALPVIAHPVPANLSKTARAEGVTPFVEGRRVLVPESAEWVDEWLTEHQKFPNGSHDDQVDTTSIALSRLLLAGSIPSLAPSVASQRSVWS